MQKLHDDTKLAIARTILNTLNHVSSKHNLDEKEIYSLLSPPPNLSMGEYAFPCFILSKTLKMAPKNIAIKLGEKLSDATGTTCKHQAEGPYLNFFLNFQKLAGELLPSILTGQLFTRQLTTDTPKIMIEYSQPNTHKDLHVGHMRNLCLGNALVRMHNYSNYNITSCTYPGDIGTHVAKCLWYMHFHNKEQAPSSNRGTWLGKMYVLATKKLGESSPTEMETNQKQLTQIIKEINAASGEFYQLWSETRKWSIQLFNQVYKWAEVEFDQWYFESDVDNSSVEYAKKLYSEGKLIIDKGAIGMDLSDEKLGFCLLVKSDGNGLYATKDIELARKKFDEFHIEKSIYIVDTRQSHHFKQVFKTLEKIGLKNAKNCYHLAYNYVQLPEGAMSSRLGNFIPIITLTNQMENTIKKEYLSRYADEWSTDEVNKTAHSIAQGAIKYGMLRMDHNKKIIFKMDEWLQLNGESGPYIQYVFARINSLCEKLNFNPDQQIFTDTLKTKIEKNIIFKLSTFNHVVVTATEQYKTSAICSYLYDLAKAFNVFYAECPIKDAPSAKMMYSRLALAKAVSLVIKKGLDLIGIPAPPRM